MARVKHRRAGHPRRTAIRGPLSSVKAKLGITGFTPPSVAQGSGPVNPLQIDGFGFTPTSIVNFNGSNVATTYASAIALTIVVPGTTTNVPGFYPVYVTDASYPATSTTAVWAVDYPVPTLASVSPAFAFLGTGGTTTTATGTGFFNAGTFATVDGPSTGFAFASATSGVVTVPASVVNAAGDHTVVIVNPAPGGGTSVARTYQVRYRAAAITSASPTTIPIDSGDVAVTLTDSGGGYYNPAAWASGGSVGFVDGVAVPTMYLSPTQIRITVPASVTSVPGVKALTVQNPTLGGGGGTSAPFNVQVSAPSTTSLSWSTRPRAFSQFTIRINGTSFVNTDVGRMRGVSLATTFVSATALDVVIPASILAVAGADPITVRTLVGYETNGQTFTVLPWEPTAIGPTLRQYLTPLQAIDDGTGRASAWQDISGGDRSPSQPTAAKRPLIVASLAAFNGQPCLFFDATRGDQLGGIQWVELASAGLIQKLNYNIYAAAFAPPTLQINANATVIGADGATLAAACLQSTALRALDSSGTGTNVDAPSDWASAGGKPFVHRTRKTGGFLYSRANNGTEVSAAHGGNPAAFTPGNQIIGGLTGVLSPITAYVGDIVVLDADANWTHKAQLDNHFAGKYATGFPALGTVATVSSVFPTGATQFDVPGDITIGGAGFDTTVVANCDGEVLATNFNSATQVIASLTATSLATAGTKGITIANAGGISAPFAFLVAPYVPGVGPNLTAISPTSKPQYKYTFSLVCTGSNFTATSVVRVNGVPVPTTFDGVTQLTAQVPASATYASGGQSVTVVDGPNTSAPQVLTITARGPGDIANVTARYKASNVNVSGSNITQALDLTANNFHLAQATTAKQPTLIPTDANFNGKPSMSFDGVDDSLIGSQSIGGVILNNFNFGVYIAYRFTAITGTGTTTNPWNNNNLAGMNTAAWYGIAGSSTPVPTLYAYMTDGTFKTASHTGLANAKAQQAILSRSSPNLQVYLNGVAGTGITMGNPNMSSQLLTLGSQSGSLYANARIPEAMFTNATPTSDNIELWTVYCASEYGMPLPP